MEKFFKELMDNGLDALKRFNDFKGRTSRKEFWKLIIAAFIGGIALAMLSAIPVLGKLFGIVGIIILAIFWFREGDPSANKYGPKPAA